MRVVAKHTFGQVCRHCKSELHFQYEDTFETSDYLGDKNSGRYFNCPVCKTTQRVKGL